jgi:hypothetical protein
MKPSIKHNITKNKRNKMSSRKGKTTSRKNATWKYFGGKRRVEKVYITFGKNHTNPDISSDIRIIKGPASNNAEESRMGYLVNFVASTANDFEEELAQILKGLPEVDIKRKKYEMIFYDNDAPMLQGSETPLSANCKSKPAVKKAPINK